MKPSVAALLLLFPHAALFAQMSIVPDTTRTIYTTGRASVSVPPDTAEVSLGIHVIKADVRSAKNDADAVVGRLLKLAESLQIPEKDLRTTSMYVSPAYDNDNPTRLLGYEVTRSVDITLRDLTLLDRLLDGSITAGANRNFDVDLSVASEADLRKKVTALALKDAREQADFAADQLGVKVGGVRSITLNKALTTTAMASSYTAIRGTFLPGDIKVDAEVSVNFYLQ